MNKTEGEPPDTIQNPLNREQFKTLCRAIFSKMLSLGINKEEALAIMKTIKRQRAWRTNIRKDMGLNNYGAY